MADSHTATPITSVASPLLEDAKLPAALMAHKSKLYGLTISPARLFQIRKERRAHGRYATQPQVTWELQADAIFRRHGRRAEAVKGGFSAPGFSGQ